MNSQDEINRAAERLRDALGAAADVMGGTVPAPRRAHPGRAWFAPLAAAAAVVTVVLASALVAGNFGEPTRTGGGTAPADGAAAALPEFYLVVDLTTNNHDALEVRRTSDGALTSAISIPAVGDTEYLTADASGRIFYFANIATCTERPPVSRFYRITTSNSGRITGYTAVGSPVRGMVLSLAVSPDGSQMAYTFEPTGCANSATLPGPVTAINVMDLSTGAVRTWQSTVTTPGPDHVTNLADGLSWAPDGRTVVAVAYWGGSNQASGDDLSVFGLDTAGSGGSLQASSRVLLSQDQNCVACVTDAVAGPDGSLTAVEFKRGRQLVVRIPPGAGGAQTVLYSATAPPPADAEFSAVFADSSGQWVITWPPFDDSKPGSQSLLAGWIRDGRLVPLPGSTELYASAIAW